LSNPQTAFFTAVGCLFNAKEEDLERRSKRGVKAKQQTKHELKEARMKQLFILLYIYINIFFLVICFLACRGSDVILVG